MMANIFCFFIIYKTDECHHALCLFKNYSVNRSQMMSNCGKDVDNTFQMDLVPLFLFLPHFGVIFDLCLLITVN